MDGPSVNVKFYTELLKIGEEAQLPTCSLHVIHGSFQTGINFTNWEMKDILKGSFQLLHDLLAPRANYSGVTGLDIFPFYPCTTRWVEGKKVADRPLELWKKLT